MWINSRNIAISGILFFLSLVLFLINIQFPRGHNFDEFHYVPSAKQFLELKENQNWEHPPLGKLLMAGGIGLWGDRPIGWRFMSTVFGSLTLVGFFFLALALFHEEEIAIWVALASIANQLLYVQARIGMLDTFMFAFLTWALVAFCATWHPDSTLQQNRRWFYFCGICFGLGMACKWFGIVLWVACCGLIATVRLFQKWQVSFGHPRPEEDWFRPGLWRGIHWKTWVLSLGVVPLVVYFLTFLPFLWVHGINYSIWDFFGMQIKMFSGQLRVVNSHPYMSQWLDWPQLRRPIWYAFDREGDHKEWVRGVLLLGNPLMMWSGLLALGVCAWDLIKRRNREAFLILYFYLASYACWAFIPRKIAFYYYYYPAGMILSLALGYVFHTRERGPIFKDQWARWLYLGVAFAFFIYFFPILAALKIPADGFRKWMWFQSWI